jgi:hypothetical protein
MLCTTQCKVAAALQHVSAAVMEFGAIICCKLFKTFVAVPIHARALLNHERGALPA